MVNTINSEHRVVNVIIVHELLARSFPANQPLGVWLVIRRLQFRAKRLTNSDNSRKKATCSSEGTL